MTVRRLTYFYLLRKSPHPFSVKSAVEVDAMYCQAERANRLGHQNVDQLQRGMVVA
jgi:hypothetical protein